MQPELWIIAGVNGAGKTTFTTCRKFKMPIVNPDVLPGAPVEQGIAAVKQRGTPKSATILCCRDNGNRKYVFENSSGY